MSGKRTPKDAPANAGAKQLDGLSFRKFGGLTIRMPDTPLTPHVVEVGEGIPLLVDPEFLASQLAVSRRYFEALADRIEHGDPTLTKIDGISAAMAIRAYATQIPDVPRRGKGRLPEIDPGRLAIRFAKLHYLDGLSKTAAYGLLEEEFQVSITAIKKALKKHGARALEMFEPVRVEQKTK